MLSELYIKNIVLIDELKITFNNSFSVFTGQTGAGKSILLGSLALALGDRADFNLIKQNNQFAEVIAVFKLANNHIAINMLQQNGFSDINEIIIKRQLFVDGRSKAFINDTPVSLAFLKSIGDVILDIHGQGDNYLLLHTANHRNILDKFLPNKELLLLVENSYNKYLVVKQEVEDYKNNLQQLQNEEQYLKLVYDELKELNLQDKEEEDLVEKKAFYANYKKIFSYLNTIENNLEDSGLLKNLNYNIKVANNLLETVNNPFTTNIVNNLEQSYISLEKAQTELNNFKNSFNISTEEVDSIDERLINIRSAAKKYKMSVTELYSYITTVSNKINLINEKDVSSSNLYNKLKLAEEDYLTLCNTLHNERTTVASNLTNLVNLELNFLLLKDTEFLIEVTKLNIEHSLASGINKVTFKIKTNKSNNFGNLQDIASGGEMARLMLALKMVFSKVEPIGTIILDEIDVGVGGEVAMVIGKRLKQLSQFKQVMVVTHSHQVASCGIDHFKVIKIDINNNTVSGVVKLTNQQRIEEIARMLSGSVITENAINIAKNMLLENSV